MIRVILSVVEDLSRGQRQTNWNYVGVVEIRSDFCLVYVIYTMNLFLYLYGLFLVSNFVCDLLFLC